MNPMTDDLIDDEPVRYTPGEFTAFCNHYYNLTKLLKRQHAHMWDMLEDAPHYEEQTKLSEIDAIIAYYRNAQNFRLEIDKTVLAIKELEITILAIMNHFGIPAGMALTGVMPGELEYEIWAEENGAINIVKTKTLAPGENDISNIITIKPWSKFDEKEVEDW